MASELFPKPLPVEPLPELNWLKRTDRAEVGREAFFCGRDAEYEVFRDAVESLRSGNIGGGTCIFQGAPGAGKTALMLECMEAVRQHSTPEEPWVAVSVKPHTLQYAAATAGMIVREVNAESGRLAVAGTSALSDRFKRLLDLGAKLLGELSGRGFAAAGLSVGGRAEPGDMASESLPAEQAFADAAPLLREFRIAVFVDEAQNTPDKGMTRGVLGCLHNPPFEIPLIAMFFGLSDTKAALRECGLSRPPGRRVADLEPLPISDARDAVRRMLDAYYSGSGEEKSMWADKLARLSQGWPQHINCVGVAAGEVLRANEGRLRRELLAQAVAEGAERMNAYYRERIESGSGQPWVYKQIALAAGNKESEIADALSYDEIKTLTKQARQECSQSTDEFLTNALHAGILAPSPEFLDQYKIPIPSLGDYLRSIHAEPPQAG